MLMMRNSRAVQWWAVWRFVGRLHVQRLIACSIMSVMTWSHASAQAPTPIVYPAKGQSAEQTKKDQGQCHAWAVQNTGFDPTKPEAPPIQAATPAQGQQQQHAHGHRARGVVRGAAVGAAVGEIANDDAGKGAAYGAAVGVLASRRQERLQAAQHQQQVAKEQQNAAAQQAANLDAFKRANAACLDARGYVVR